MAMRLKNRRKKSKLVVVKQTVFILYWVVMIFLMSLLFWGLNYIFVEALFVALSFLPTVLGVHYLWQRVEWRLNAKSVFENVCFLGAIYFIQFLILFLTQTLLLGVEATAISSLLSNPVFLLLIVGAYYMPYKILSFYLAKNDRKPEEPRFVEFTSERRRVKLAVDDIFYIESRDDEVWLWLVGGEKLRSRTNISGWSVELGNGFVRIHRSFLVSIKHIERVESTKVVVRGLELDISRSYKERVKNIFSTLN